MSDRDLRSVNHSSSILDPRSSIIVILGRQKIIFSSLSRVARCSIFSSPVYELQTSDCPKCLSIACSNRNNEFDDAFYVRKMCILLYQKDMYRDASQIKHNLIKRGNVPFALDFCIVFLILARYTNFACLYNILHILLPVK